MASDSTPPSSLTPARRWAIAIQVGLSACLFLAIVGMLNYVAARHPWRLEWGRQSRFELSGATRQILASLTNEVQVTVFFDRDEPLFSTVMGLLREYQLASPRIRLRHVDYTRYPDEALVIKSRYRLPATEQVDQVIFESQGGVRLVSQGELSEFDLEPILSGRSREVRRTHFKGELLFTSAIVAATDPQTPKAYFLQDQGEHPLDNQSDASYGQFQQVLQNQKVSLEPLRFRGTNDVPADCQLLIIAGPRTRFAPDSLNRLEQYLQRGGRMMVLMNYLSLTNQTGLESLLAHWGVEVSRGVIVDPDNSTTGQNVLSTRIGTHPVVRPLVLDQVPVDVLLPRALFPLKASGGDAPRVDALAMSGEASVLVTEMAGGSLRPTARDRKGAFPFLVAVEKGNIQGVTTDRGNPRLIVAGDSYFLSNGWIDRKANAIFAGYAVNWLLDRSLQVGGIQARAIRSYRISLTQSELRQVRWVLLGALPGTVVLAGLLVWTRRRR